LRAESLFENKERLMMGYSLLKYAIILMRSLNEGLEKEELEKEYPTLRWREFFEDSEHEELAKDLTKDLNSMEKEFSFICDSCTDYMSEITQINPAFEEDFDKEIRVTEFEGAFKSCYRHSTVHLYKVLRGQLKEGEETGSRLPYMMCLIILSHAFNQIYRDPDCLQELFGQYIEESKVDLEKFSFNLLRNWLTTQDEETLTKVATNAINLFFKH
jgi:hypothetical protein